MLIKAGQPEILRAAQRDELFLKHLSEKISEILQSVFGVHFWVRYKELSNSLINVLYSMMTTMLNLQTLGEEYTGIVQSNNLGNSLPNKYLQMLMIFINNFGEKIFTNALLKFENKIKSLPENHPLQNSARIEFLKFSHTLRYCLPIFQKFHKSFFYFNGNYYDIGKRVSGIRYVLIRYWLKNKSSISAFKALGTISIIHTTLHLLLTFSNYKNMKVEEENFLKTELTEPQNSSDKCSLCLNVRKSTSVTPCGHLFCWSCIIPWLQEQHKCPLCRQVFQPSRIVLLQNFST